MKHGILWYLDYSVLFAINHHIGLFCSAACSFSTHFGNVTLFLAKVADKLSTGTCGMAMLSPTTIAVLLDCGEGSSTLSWPIQFVNKWRLGTLGRLRQQIFICSRPSSEALGISISCLCRQCYFHGGFPKR